MLAICILLALIVVGLILQLQLLSSRISTLENQTSNQTAELTSYKRTLCSNKDAVTPVSQLTKYNLDSAGYVRSYQVHTPNNYDPSVRYPVILSFDGIEGSGGRMERYSGLDTLPAVVVYPDSLPGKKTFTAWEGAPYSVDGERDVQFVHELLQTLPSQYCVDSTRIFAVGMSNGGLFATIVGCELGDQIRAVASVSGAFYTTCKQEQRTPSLLVIHSTDDRQTPFAGVQARHLPQITAWVDQQAVERNCKTKIAPTTIQSSSFYSWADCSDSSTLRLVVLQNQPHGWLKVPQASSQRPQGTAGYIWKFFDESTYRD